MPVLKRFASSDDVIGVVLQDGGMRPTAYRRNARGLRDRQAFEGVRMQAGRAVLVGLPVKVPLARSPDLVTRRRGGGSYP
jgi:hypothetical protein